MGGNPWGGSEELWAATAFEALECGHEVCISVLRWGDDWPPKLRELQRCGAKIFRRYDPVAPGRDWLLGPVSTHIDLFKTNPDVILISEGGCFDAAADPDLRRLLYVAPIPFVVVCQFNHSLPVIGTCRDHAYNIISRAFRVLFVSNQNRVDAERQLTRVIPRWDLVRNPVNLSDCSYMAWPDSRTARFASVARLQANVKGQDVLIEALGADEWKQRDWHLTLYGSGPDEHYLRSLTAFFGLQERISFAGQVSEVRAIWAQEQVLVMFSRAEGAPLALAESMLCGRPAIVSDVGGNKEWVSEPQTGFIADAPVVGLARAALDRAWSARENWKAMGMQAHEAGTARIGDPTILRLLDILSEACRRRKTFDRKDAKELERAGEYRALTHARMAPFARDVARRILARCKAARARFEERRLLPFLEPKTTD